LRRAEGPKLRQKGLGPLICPHADDDLPRPRVSRIHDPAAGFAIEVGFLDAVRKPLSDAFRTRVEAIRTPQGERCDFDEFNRRKAAYQLPRFCGYFYASTCAFVCDGCNEITVLYRACSNRC